MKRKPFSIAIDGPAGAGKSTVAKAVAAEMNAMYLDTGAMYRAFGLYMLRRGAANDRDAIIAAVNDVDITVEFLDGAQHIFLGEEDVSATIREPEVSMAASDVSAVPEVRERMVALQGHGRGRSLGSLHGPAHAKAEPRMVCQNYARDGESPPPFFDEIHMLCRSIQA